ncbi:MAG: hypothetical protein ABI592_14260 [Acidobacteriota bacterium]
MQVPGPVSEAAVARGAASSAARAGEERPTLLASIDAASHPSEIDGAPAGLRGTLMRRRLAPAAFPYVIFLVLLAASWNRWMEPFVDSGRELMIPARVAAGESLYRDLHFHHGPLAPWLGALVEKAAPRSIAARTLFALAVAAAGLEALRRLAARWMPGWNGSAATALAVAIAYFLRPGGWLFPFSFDTAIAVASATGALALLAGPATRRRDAAAGTLLLAALLSRPELGIAAVAAALLDARKHLRRTVLLGAAPLGLAAAVYFIASAGIPFEKLVADGWLALLRPPQAFRNVYRAYAGLDQPGLRAAQVALAAILVLLACCLLAAAAAVSERTRARTAAGARAVEAAFLGVLAACAAVFVFPPAPWQESLSLFPPLVRTVPVLCLGIGLARLRALASRRPAADSAPGVSDGALLLAVLFGARLLLAAGYSGPYNAFFLPLPIAVAAVAAFRSAARWSPALGRSLPRLVLAALLVFVVLRTAEVARLHRGPGWETLSTAAGSVVLPSVEASTARLVIADLEGRLPRPRTLTGFPEAGFFEYVLEAGNPLPLEQFWPGHLDGAGERRTIAGLLRRPPDALLLVNALAVGEGARAFGTDYSRELGGWIEAETRPAASYGPGAGPAPRVGDPQFFVQVRIPAGGKAAHP